MRVMIFVETEQEQQQLLQALDARGWVWKDGTKLFNHRSATPPMEYELGDRHIMYGKDRKIHQDYANRYGIPIYDVETALPLVLLDAL